MSKQDPLVDSDYLLEKIAGKGGWTYAALPEVLQNKKNRFGFVRVRGTIDGFVIKQYHLMPMGKGKLFLPVRAEIRKKIKKEAGQYVRVVLYEDPLPTEMPDELKLCFENEPQLLEKFLAHDAQTQQAAIAWIYAAKSDEIKVQRILQLMDQVAKELPLHF
ncbi:MAG: DUF1905 domain-containing protein [Cytophagales bacterium]|nr:MAG: DUF1905 domain-containing protein [Cytophagales bacterium]TAF59450.1 MAG: DUF1905 domain-containing protein [Cytophagales bacterium]